VRLLVLSLLRHDLHGFRALIAGWLLLVIALTFFDGVRPLYERDLDEALGLSMARGLLWIAMQLVGLLLVARVIQADPPTGSDAFWMTRPIAARSLLASKLTLLGGLMVGVPMFAQIVLMAACHMPAGAIARASLQAVLFDTLWLSGVVSIASLTATVAHFLLLGTGAIAASSLMTAIAMVGRVRTASVGVLIANQAGTPDLPFPARDPTADVVQFILAAVAGFVLIATQYRSRLRTRSVPVGAAGLSVAYAAAALWPWPILRPVDTPPAWASGNSTVQLRASDSITLSSAGGEYPNGRTAQVTGRAQLWVSDLEPGWIPSASLIDASLTLDDRRTLRSSGFWYPAPSPIESTYRSPQSEVARQLLRIQDLAPVSPDTPIQTALVLADLDLSEGAPTSGKYDGRFQINLTRCHLVATLPLRSGVLFQDGPYRLTIDEVTRSDDAVALLGRESEVHSEFDRRSRPAHWFYLRNTRAGEAITAHTQAFEAGGLSFSLPGLNSLTLPLLYGLARFPSAFDTHGISIRFPSFLAASTKSDQAGSRPSLNAEWIAGAELAVVRATREGAVVRTLHIPRVRLEKAR
jgi:hypothetical protein